MVTYCTDTLVEIRKHTGLINSTLNFNGPLTSAQRVLCINTVRNEIAAIVQALTQLNWACIGHWGDGIPDLGVARLDTLNAVLALVWEVIFTIRSAMSKLQVCKSSKLLPFAFTASNLLVRSFLRCSLSLLQRPLLGLLKRLADVHGE